MRIHSIYKGIRGFVSTYNSALKYAYMISDKAQSKAKTLAFWEKHGLQATLDAFPVKRATLFCWKKQLKDGGGKLESLNEKSRTPHTKRKRIWNLDVIAEIKRQRWEHPNLGKEKLYPILKKLCEVKTINCPKPKTIGRLIKDLGGLRVYPQKVSHFGKVRPVNRQKVLRKPKNFNVEYPGHLVALDTIEKHVYGSRRYVITFEDIYTRFSFAWATTSHASLAAKELFDYCRKVFPFPFYFVLTDNGSEFKKHFAEELKRLHLIHYHTYPRTPKMNAHVERFNRTIQDEFVDYHMGELLNPAIFNRKLMDWLIWYNTERVHFAFQNKMSPLQFMLSLEPRPLPTLQKSNIGWPHTHDCKSGKI